MADVVISEFMDESAIREHLGEFTVHYDPKLVDQPQRLQDLLRDCRALIVRNRTQVHTALLDATPRLRVVGRLGVGLDNIDLQACAAHRIRVIPATGANDLAVAEYVICAAFILLRRVWYATADVARGSWPRMTLIGQELAGKRLGLLGYGSIARLTARKALALGMTVAAYDPFVPPQDTAWQHVFRLELPALLSESDVVSLHTPLTPQTQHLIDAGALARMKRGAVLINAARGGVVDERALRDALRDGHISGAALDVFESEPLSADDGQPWHDLENVILTPHIAGVTAESNVRVSDLTARSVRAVLSGA